MSPQLQLQYGGFAIGLGLLLSMAVMARNRSRSRQVGRVPSRPVAVNERAVPSQNEASLEVELDPLLRLSVPTVSSGGPRGNLPPSAG